MTELELVEKRMEELRVKKRDFCKPIDEEFKELLKLRKKLVPKIIDFSEYEGREIAYIEAVDSNGNDVLLPTDEIAKVKNGKPFFSSYNGGIVDFDENIGKYVYYYRFSETVLDIVGFYDVVFEGEEDASTSK